jgi:membrane dipeptidase
MMIFDGHNDVLISEDFSLFATGRPGGHLDLPRMLAGGMRAGMFAIFTPLPSADHSEPAETNPPVDHEYAAAFSTAAAGRLHALERAGTVRIIRDLPDFDAVMAGEGPPGAVLHLEGAEAIDPGLESLEFWYGAGLRSLGPVWSRPNAFGTGAPIPGPRDPDDGPGLTEAGIRLVKACSELGILIDLSHMNRTAFWDVARLEAGPLVATHAAAYSLSPSARNLTDDQIDEVGKTNGLIGIVFGALFVRPDCRNDADTDLALIAAHARYVADRIGVEHVALGSDFDGTTVPSALGDAAGLPRLLDALSDAGFTSDELRMIGFENWRRVLAAWW